MLHINNVSNYDLNPNNEAHMNALLDQSKQIKLNKKKPKGLIVGVYVQWPQHIIALPNPRRHPHCIWCGARVYGPWRGHGHTDQGFFTENFTMLDRYMAREYAFEIEQIDKSRLESIDILFSEDLW